MCKPVCFICPHVEKDQHMYLIYAEVHLRYHKVNIYKFEGDSEMFDLWLSECAKYNAVISITANYPGTDRTCVTQNEGVVSQQNKLSTYTKRNKPIPWTRKWIQKTNLQHVNVTESQQKPSTCKKKFKKKLDAELLVSKKL